jgi:hypothetical protein
MWWLTWRRARHSHPTKPKKWIARRYFGRFNKFRNDRWVFGARDYVVNDPDDVAHLIKFSWTAIVRHQLVAGRASPDDPELTDYWAARRRKVTPPLDAYNLRLLAMQDGRCPLCGDHLLAPDQPPQSPHDWERWWLSIVRRAIAADHLTHHGARRHAGREPNTPRARHLPPTPTGATAQEPDVALTRDAPGACLSRGAGKARSLGSEMKLKGEWAGDSTPAEPGLGLGISGCGGELDADQSRSRRTANTAKPTATSTRPAAAAGTTRRSDRTGLPKMRAVPTAAVHHAVIDAARPDGLSTTPLSTSGGAPDGRPPRHVPRPVVAAVSARAGYAPPALRRGLYWPGAAPEPPRGFGLRGAELDGGRRPVEPREEVREAPFPVGC